MNHLANHASSTGIQFPVSGEGVIGVLHSAERPLLIQNAYDVEQVPDLYREDIRRLQEGVCIIRFGETCAHGWSVT